jgi:hypothetical protein
VVLVPFSDDVAGTTVSGVVPEGWEGQGFGAYARAATGLDPTAILQQAVPGLPATSVAGIIAGQLGTDTTEAGTYESGGRTWTLYQFDVSGQTGDMAVTDDGDYALIVVLFTTPAERDALYQSVFLPALDAIRAG